MPVGNVRKEGRAGKRGMVPSPVKSERGESMVTRGGKQPYHGGREKNKRNRTLTKK